MSDAVPMVDHSARMEKVAKLSGKVAHVLAGERLEDKVSVLVTALVNETVRTPIVYLLSEMVHQAVGEALGQICACDECAKKRQTS